MRRSDDDVNRDRARRGVDGRRGRGGLSRHRLAVVWVATMTGFNTVFRRTRRNTVFSRCLSHGYARPGKPGRFAVNYWCIRLWQASRLRDLPVRPDGALALRASGPSSEVSNGRPVGSHGWGVTVSGSFVHNVLLSPSPEPLP